MKSFPQVNGYDIIEKVGSGSFSAVYKAFTKTQSKEVVAIKCLEKRFEKKLFVDSIINEISLLKLLKHDYIVKLVDFLWDPKHIFIITEFCDGGDLSQFIKKKHKLPESLVRTFMQQLALALKFLHNLNICHMDLKPQNLLLVTNPILKLKVADFGLSQILSSKDTEQTRYTGSLLYMAPEKLLNQQFDAKVDLWSVGIIMYECLFGRPPYNNLNWQDVIDFIAKKTPIDLPVNACITKECEDLLRSLLKYDPNERIGFEEFFNYKFIDLVHVATSENYLTAVKLIEEAITMDKAQEYSTSLAKYKEAVKYLETFINIETDLNKKAVLNLRYYEYNQRIKALTALIDGSSSEQYDVSKTLPRLTISQHKLLYDLSTATPNIATGLEIGNIGELYLSEGKKKLALEKLTSALSILIPLLTHEPSGARKKLLYAQIQTWLSLAESIKHECNN